EWLPPSLSWPVNYTFFVTAVVWLAIVGLRWRHLRGLDDWTLVLLGLVLILLGFRAVRHTALFTVAAVPLISQGLTWLPQPAVRLARPRNDALHLVAVGLLALGCVALVARVWNDDRWMGWAPFSPDLVAAVRDCPGPLYNTYDTGGALLWF